MITVGNVGSSWRASVTPWGAVRPADGKLELDWWVAADDRWHVPSREPSVRQRRIGGAPVVETALRVPDGDALQRVYAVADEGGLTVVEVENASPLPFAVAFSHGRLLTARPPTTVPVHGIDLPADAIVLPVGHRTTLRVAMAHDGRGPGTLARSLPTAEQVARGWRAQTEAGVRVEGLDEMVEPLVAARAELLLEGPGDANDAAGFLLGLVELVRLGAPATLPAEEVAALVESLAKSHRRARLPWDVAAALDAAGEVLRHAGEARAARDVDGIVARAGAAEALPEAPPAHAGRYVAWVVRRLVSPRSDGADLLPALPAAWHRRNLAVYAMPVPGGTVSFALRWHGPRPALLWDTTGDVTLRATALDPSWSTTAASGETLLAAPAGD